MNKKGVAFTLTQSILIVLGLFVLIHALGYQHVDKTENTKNFCSEVPGINKPILENLCGSYQGEWSCNQDKVSCEDFTSNQISCISGEVLKIKEKCEEIGGEFICDSKNLICRK